MTTGRVSDRDYPQIIPNYSQDARFERNRSIAEAPQTLRRLIILVAGAEGLEPTTNGFGDRYSTN